LEVKAELDNMIKKRKEHENEFFRAETTCKQLQAKIVKLVTFLRSLLGPNNKHF